MPLAEFTLGHALLVVLEIFLFIAWLWILFAIIGDLFRDEDLSGWAKGAWVLFLIVVPFFAAVIYLVARGDGMRERSVREQAEVKSQLDAYIRSTAGQSPVEELAKLSDLRDKGAISDAEFEQAKSKLLA